MSRIKEHIGYECAWPHSYSESDAEAMACAQMEKDQQEKGLSAPVKPDTKPTEESEF